MHEYSHDKDVAIEDIIAELSRDETLLDLANNVSSQIHRSPPSFISGQGV